MLPIVVPAEIYYAPRLEHHIVVVSGTNWDLSITALATPVALLPGTKPISMPIQSRQVAKADPLTKNKMEPVRVGAALLTVRFQRNSAALSHMEREKLLKLPRNSTLAVVAAKQIDGQEPKALSAVRVKIIAALLRASGHIVTELQAMSQNAAAESTAAEPGSVEIFAVVKGA